MFSNDAFVQYIFSAEARFSAIKRLLCLYYPPKNKTMIIWKDITPSLPDIVRTLLLSVHFGTLNYFNPFYNLYRSPRFCGTLLWKSCSFRHIKGLIF